MSEVSEEIWYRLEVLVQGADEASALLWQLGALGVEVQDRETYMEGVTFAPVPEGWSRQIAFFSSETSSADETPEAVMTALTRAGIKVELISFARYDDRSWETAWKEFFKPLRLSRRSIVGPPWETFDAPEKGFKIVIEPGMAFGTGTHETTQLCAQILDDLLDGEAPARVLDVGCGSAILSILAAHLGAETVIGTDIDAHAVQVARDNIVANGLQEAITLTTTPVEAIEGTYEFVVANIIAPILLILKEGLQARVAPEGSLILGGITEAMEPQVLSAFVTCGWRLVERRQAGEWISMHIVRNESEGA